MLVTTNTRNRTPVFADPSHAREAIETLYRVQNLHPFFLYGFVIMPDHCHLLLRVPQPGSIETIMKQFKGGVSHNIGKGPIWQPRFHLCLPANTRAALRYIHRNPMEGGLVESPGDYPWSSANHQWDVSDFEIGCTSWSGKNA